MSTPGRSSIGRERVVGPIWLDAELAEGCSPGPLHGIPIGVKDIFDVAGMPTSCGVSRWRDRIAEENAPLVDDLLAAGAVIVGKTVTTPFAWIDPPETRNPWDLSRTPGGSSSGSAAALASGMVLGAIGSQTGGSIIRPSAFCGVVGLKPTYGSLPITGIQALSPSLDHPGPLARTVADLETMWLALKGSCDESGAFPDRPVFPDPPHPVSGLLRQGGRSGHAVRVRGSSRPATWDPRRPDRREGRSDGLPGPPGATSTDHGGRGGGRSSPGNRRGSRSLSSSHRRIDRRGFARFRPSIMLEARWDWDQRSIVTNIV